MVKSSNVIHANDFATAAFPVKLLKTIATVRLSYCILNGEGRTRSSLHRVKSL